MRRLIEFRLLPVGDVLRDPGEVEREEPGSAAEPAPPTQPPGPVSPTDIETLRSKSFERAVRAQAQIVRREELVLVHDFAEWLDDAHDLASTGLRIPYHPEHRSLRADLFITAPRVLVEAKVSAAREHIRMALGQLLDYRRYIKPRPQVCVLTPARPTDDMLELLDEFSVGVAWRDDDRFTVEPSSLLNPDVHPSGPLG